MSTSHRKTRRPHVLAFGHGTTLHVFEVRRNAVLAALWRSLRPRRAWSRVIVGLAVFLVVMAIIGALSPRPTSTHATGKSLAAVSPVSPAPPASVVTFGQGEIQTTSPELAANLGRAFGARGDIYLVRQLAWPTVGADIAWTFPAGCDHDDAVPCQAVDIRYETDTQR